MKKILIIEDTPSIREELSMLLRFEGYDVIETESGSEGFELSRMFKPDLIISDIFMLEMDGFDTLAEIRKNKTTMDIPFIFLTTAEGKTTRLLAKELGADDYIIKPFNISKLIEAIKIQINKRTSAIIFIDEKVSI